MFCRNFQFKIGSRSKLLLPFLTLAAGMALTGCGDKTDDAIEDTPVRRVVMDTSVIRKKPDLDGIPAADANPSKSAAAAALSGVVPGASGDPVSNARLSDMDTASQQGEDGDYIKKADIYWKLNWARKTLLNGSVSASLGSVVAEARQQLTQSQRNELYTLTDTVITHLEAGLRHTAAQQTLEATQVNRRQIPWGAGKAAVQQFIEKGGLGFGGKRPAPPKTSGRADKLTVEEDDLLSLPPAGVTTIETLTFAQKKALATIYDYAANYQAAPEEMMRREWKLAVRAFYRLRDRLQHHPSAIHHPGVGTSAQDSDREEAEPGVTSVEMLPTEPQGGTGVTGVVPVPPISGASNTGGSIGASGTNGANRP